MQHKTEGILIRKTKLPGNKLLLAIYTKEYGMVTYSTRLNRKDKKSFLPLSLVIITSNGNPNNDILPIKEYETLYPLSSVYQDIYKSNILIFLNEILQKVIKEQEANYKKFYFIKTQLILFETAAFDVDFHLKFLMRLTEFLGVKPTIEKEKLYYDYEEGESLNEIPVHSSFFDEKETVLFSKLFDFSFGEMASHNLTNIERKQSLQVIVDYYEHHAGINEVKSLAVLEVVFS